MTGYHDTVMGLQVSDASQADRERMCADLLPLLGSYNNVEPRRPRGGRDGGRDIQAVYIVENKKVFCAVGFKNWSSNPENHVKEIFSKFKEDLKSAKKAKTDLFGFIFLTNIDLTPKDVQNLIDHAKKEGIEHCEVFPCEKLRVALDSTLGIGLRLKYLGIKLSLEELSAFVEYTGQRHAEELLKLEQMQADLIQEQKEMKQAASSLLQTVNDVSERLNLATTQIIATSTGGDSFCYLMPMEINKVSETDNRLIMNYAIIPRGNYPLFEVSFEAFDLIHKKEMEELLVKKDLLKTDLLRDTEVFFKLLEYCIQRKDIGNISPIRAIGGFTLDKLHGNSMVDLKINFSARNGTWNQKILCHSDKAGIWHKEMRVFRDQEMIFESTSQFCIWETDQQADSI